MILFVINRGNFDAGECQFKNTKDKSINVKMHKGYNVVRPIMPTSPNERESFDYS